MIGAEFGQLAAEYDMKRDQGVAYGIVEGYAATFLDGAGVHRIMLTTRFPSNSKKDDLMDIVNGQDLKNLYGIRKLQIAKKVVYVAFSAGADSISKIRDFIAWFFPLLEEYGASKADVCTQCQKEIPEEDACWILRDGATAFRMHTACAEELKLSIRGQSKTRGVSPDGSVLKGILGAFLGAVLGAILWYALQLINFYTPIAGMAIGFTTVYGYGFLKGKISKLRIPIALIAGFFSIALGLYFSYVLPQLSKSGAGFMLSFFRLFSNQDFLSEFMGSFVLGSIFLVLGIFMATKSEGRSNNMVVTDLK